MKKNDFVLLILVLCLSSASLIFMSIRKNINSANLEVAKVVVSIGGEEKYSFDLSKSAKQKIETDLGYNEIEIKNNEVIMLDADCPDKLCIHQGKISKDSETIVCLPHKLIVEIRSKDKSDIDMQR